MAKRKRIHRPASRPAQRARQAPPHDPHAKEYLRLAADAAAAKLPDNHGFVLITTPVGAEGRVNYIANIDREDAVAMLKTLLFAWGKDEAWMKHTD